MIDLSFENYEVNAKLLLQGIWYSDLPDLLDMSELSEDLDNIISEINNKKVLEYKQDEDNFISEWRNISSPKYLRAPGVEAITFFDFKKNKSLREMQIPNLLHYISFIYNTLLEFTNIFEKLYIDEDNSKIIENSNSYLVYGDEFVMHTYETDDEGQVSTGTFTTKNNKMNHSAIMAENKKRYLMAEADYIFSLKMDIESFFPNLYTHNFEKMAKLPPYSTLGIENRYFIFLDQFHQRINNNQTKGIPAGIFSSHIAAELCMLCVDQEIRKLIDSYDRRIGYIRYVDDLTFFCDSENELSAILPPVQSVLNKYRLRINGNKTELLHTIHASQPTYITEIYEKLPYIKDESLDQKVELHDFYLLKRYISSCLIENRISQIRSLLSIILKRLEEQKMDVGQVHSELFYYLLKLVFENELLVSHVYRLLDVILLNSDSKEKLMSALLRKKSKVDSEYPDTILQIWHYYIIMKNGSKEEKDAIIDSLGNKILNPLIVTSMISFGKGTNKKVFKYIKDSYINESGTTEWKKEIMFSKWWLPLFKLSRYDTHNYDNFIKSNNFPSLFKMFSAHNDDYTLIEDTDVASDNELFALLS